MNNPGACPTNMEIMNILLIVAYFCCLIILEFGMQLCIWTVELHAKFQYD